MKHVKQEIADFLHNPAKVIEELYRREDAYTVFAIVDWREYDENIIGYINHLLPEHAQIRFEFEDNGKPYGDDIVLVKDTQKYRIEYPNGKMDRDTTLHALAQYLQPEYELRWFMESLGEDTLLFCVLPAHDWQELAHTFGAEKVDLFFQKVTVGMPMFNIGIDRVQAMFKTFKEAKQRVYDESADSGSDKNQADTKC